MQEEDVPTPCGGSGEAACSSGRRENFVAITGPTPPGQKEPFGHISQTLGVSDREK
jgi:hypothetical protein